MGRIIAKMQARHEAHIKPPSLMKYTFAEVSIKTIRLHEQTSQPADTPLRVRELWENYVTQSDWYDPDKEAFVVFLLNTRLNCIGFNLVSLGGLNSTSCHAREVFRSAIAGAAHGIAIAHNHPSGDPTPSDADRRATRQLSEAGKLLGIEVMDHVVIGDGKHFSFREHGMI
jgi:DNA repair protein RadC